MVQGVDMKWLKRGNFWARCTLARISSALSRRDGFFVDPGGDGNRGRMTHKAHCHCSSLFGALP